MKTRTVRTTLIGILFFFSYIIGAADIHERVKANDLDGVNALIEANPQILAERDETGRTALHWAARGTNVEMIRLLVSKGADLNGLDNNGIAPLHSLASRGHVESARVLLEKGANVDVQMPVHQTPLYLAALRQFPEMVRLLVAHKANLEHRDDYQRTPLILASREMAGPEIVGLLLDLGADIKAADRWQDTALTLAAWRGSDDVVNLLLQRQAPIPEGRLRTELMKSSVEKGLVNLFLQLNSLGTDLNQVLANGKSLLHVAAEGGSIPIMEVLLSKQLKVNQPDSNGWMPLHFASDMGRLEAIELLLSKGADLQSRTLMGQTAANLAQDNQDQATIDFLAGKGLKLTPPRFPVLKGSYLGQKAPGRTPEVFAPGIVSGRFGLHSSIVFSPDGKAAFWTIMIPPKGSDYGGDRTLGMYLKNDSWTYPTKAVFSGVKLEDVPFFHPDGQTLFDMARRPFPDGRDSGKENIWSWSKGKKSWQKPQPLPPEVNDFTQHWQFSLDLQGNLYFCATRVGGRGEGDIYICRFVNGQYQKAEGLGEPINSPAPEEFPFITPDGKTLLFVRNFDIHVSFLNPAGQWTRPRKLGPEINTPGMENLPNLSPDGKYLFFSRHQKSMWVDASIIDDLRQLEVARFNQKSAARELEPLLVAGQVEAAHARFKAMHGGAEAKDYFIDETEFNLLGYRLLQQQHMSEAVAVMEMTTQVFPDSWNAWDSLGEVLMYSQQGDRAETCFEKSLVLNPQSPSGAENLRILRSERLGREWDRQHQTQLGLKHKPGEQTRLKGLYFGQTPPGTKPVLFAPGIVSSAKNFEFSQTYSPDGREFYFTRRKPGGNNVILVSRLEKKGWTSPIEAEFAKGYASNEPHITPDGKQLFFGSSRPRPDGSMGYGIWVAERIATSWGTPRFHGDGMYVSVSLKGNLYWTDITRSAGGGGVVFPFENGKFNVPVKLPQAINSPRDVAHSFIAPDERYLVFDSYSRPDGQGGEGDLYVSFKQPDGSWSPAQNLGDEVNGPGTNFCPSVSPDGQYLFFSSAGDIYWVSSEVIHRLRK